MDNNISCEIAKDLIPLYSEESRLTVKKHLAECVSCRRLLETPVEQEQITAVPEEKNCSES
ncbi:MAG: zf-HC2 domain-containing protein [Oscillospiraceae bacterium]|nr:zf-HC2 domain-containing protein [Oscillospiraceae bacterium]